MESRLTASVCVCVGGFGGEGLSKKKKELMGMDNSVVIVRGWGV